MVKITVLISDEMNKAIEAERARTGMDTSNVVRLAISAMLDVSPLLNPKIYTDAPVSSGSWIKDVNHVQ